MSDADTDGTAFEPEPEHEENTGGLRRGMEQRVKSLQDAEDRIRREQAALQEQAKFVFAEREARLARREKELAKREAALAVSEGIANGHSEPSPALEEREQAIAVREAALEQLAAELEAREQEVKAAGTESGSPSKAQQRRVAEL